MRFLFDEMLKKLAVWCRIFGIYSEHFSGKTDDELLRHAEKNDLILVTRDEALSRRCRSVLIRSDDVEEQLRQLIRETGIRIRFPDESRCASCNGELATVSREEVDVPPKVASKKFWKCKDCDKVFWEGGHWKNILRLYRSLLAEQEQ